MAPADYSEGRPLDLILKAIMDKVAAEDYMRRFKP